MAGQVKIKLVRSCANGTKKQQENLKGLGLKKIRQERILRDSPEVLGMIAKVAHMVEVERI